MGACKKMVQIKSNKQNLLAVSISELENEFREPKPPPPDLSPLMRAGVFECWCG